MNEHDEMLLSAYLDDELDPSERAKFEARLAADGILTERLQAWQAMRTLVVAEAEAEANDLPVARFEQIWDQVRSTLEPSSSPTVQSNVVSLPIWRRYWPVLAAAAAAVALVILLPRTAPESTAPHTPPAVAVAPSAAPATSSPNDPSSSPPQAVSNNEVQIERIEFAGQSGRIAQIEDVRGTTTVIWIEEDPQPVDSERSL